MMSPLMSLSQKSVVRLTPEYRTTDGIVPLTYVAVVT